MTREKEESDFWILIGILILVLVVILYLISTGKIDLFEKTKSSKGVDEERNKIIIKVNELKSDVEKKSELRKLLDKRAINTYNVAKYFLASFYILINMVLFLKFWSGDFTSTLGIVLNYNQAFFILFLLFAIVIPRKPISIFTLNYYLRLKIRSIYYSKTPALESEIEEINIEIKSLENKHPWLNQV